MPPKIPPIIGATQNNHNWSIAQEPWNSATAVLRAGFTEVFDTGMLIKWIKVKPKPIAIGAKPAAAFLCVEPMMINKKNAVNNISATNTASKE